MKKYLNNFYMLKIIYKISPGRVIHQFVSAILGFGEWAFFSVVFMKYLFGAEEINRSFNEILIFLICTALVFMLISAYQQWFDQIYCRKTNQIIQYELNKTLFDKSSSVDISCFENPDFYDKYTKATTEAFQRAESVLDNMSQTCASLFSSIYVIYTMFSVNILAGFFAFLPVTGNFFFGKLINKYAYQKDMENVYHNRRINYINRLLYLQKYAKEIRLTNIFNVLRNTYDEAFDGLNRNTDKYWKKQFYIEMTKNIICFPLVFEGLWLFAAYSAMVTKSILIGDFVILASAIVSTTWMLISLSGSVTASFKDAIYIDNLKEFKYYKPKIDETQKGLTFKNVQELEFINVSFRYSEAGEFVLKNISMKIRAGERVALVGHNGAGKTTLVKLIMRLYDPVEGEILLNGINIKEYDIKAYRKVIGTTFQDFQMFSMSVAENVCMNDVDSDTERERVISALKECGIYDRIMQLSAKENTILTREFDDNGAVLSGGEYQKIALARAFAKDNKILILDEPSSALDPVAEYHMYNTIMKLCKRKGKDKITVIISHRLSSAADADHVYMLEQGRIIEEGTHSALISQNGAYADMYLKQAMAYMEEYSSLTTFGNFIAESLPLRDSSITPEDRRSSGDPKDPKDSGNEVSI